MPKEGYESITIPKEVYDKVSGFVEESDGIVSTRTQAFSQAWELYEHFFIKEKNPEPVKIGNKMIGHNQQVFVIAELGINHNGDMKICKKMIDVAVESGCDAVKFQKRKLDVVYTKDFLDAPRKTPWGTTNRDERIQLEFGEEEYKEIDRYCKEKGIMWFASPWDVESVDFLEKFNVPCYKIASACLTDKDLLLRIKQTGKPIILSNGMSTLKQTKAAIDILGERNLVLLQCTSTYPSKDEDLNLNNIQTLKKYFNCPIGYSGHEPGIWGSIVAVALGACVVERHFTMDRSMFGWDHAASVDCVNLGVLTRTVKRIPTMKGSYKKRILESEIPILKDLRRVDNLFD